MRRGTEYNINNGVIYASNKYPSGLNKKWSEKRADTKCDMCDSEHTDCDLSGDLLMLCCTECENWWTGAIGTVINKSNRGEVSINLPNNFDRKDKV